MDGQARPQDPRHLIRRRLERAAELASLPDRRAQHWARVHERQAEVAVEAWLEGHLAD